MGACCAYCNGLTWPPVDGTSRHALCLPCLARWDGERLLSVLRRLMAHDVVRFATDSGPRGEGYLSDKLSSDLAAAEVLLDEIDSDKREPAGG